MESPPPTASEMQLEMARTRTLLAMDRTLLAWVRTSISLCAFGFTLAKFVHTLILSGTLKGVEATYPKHVGIVLMMLGIGGLLGGAFDYWRWLRRLGKTLEMPRATITMVVALMLACISLTLMISMIRDID